MAARKNLTHDAKTRWRFFVYDIGLLCQPAYVGKGSGARLAVQKRRFGMDGQEVARFFNEDDAYQYERARIAEYNPPLNKHPGGNGSRAKKKCARTGRYKWEREMAKIGTRVYAARMLLRFDLAGHVSPSKVEEIRRVANG